MHLQVVVQSDGMIVSKLAPTGLLPRCLPQLHDHGVDLPPGCYEAAKRQPVDSERY